MYIQIGDEEEKARRQFERMRLKVAGIHPTLTDGEIRHACNAISNGLRAWGSDIYEVRLSGSPFAHEHGYFHDFDVMAGGQKIYVRVTVD